MFKSILRKCFISAEMKRCRLHLQNVFLFINILMNTDPLVGGAFIIILIINIFDIFYYFSFNCYLKFSSFLETFYLNA